MDPDVLALIRMGEATSATDYKRVELVRTGCVAPGRGRARRS